MTLSYRRLGLLFPGQGAQYPGMAKDFYENFSLVRSIFEEADDILGRHLSRVILNGPSEELAQTKNSQPAIYVTSIALFQLLQSLFQLKPFTAAGLSLGEYTALTAANWLPFRETLLLVQKRADFMSAACEHKQGTMAVLVGLDTDIVKQMVRELTLPNDLWIANFNCPGQIVISGTLKGIEAGISAAKDKGVKRIIPLSVQGAFHSGLMKSAQHALTPVIQSSIFKAGSMPIVMNACGDFVNDEKSIKDNLCKQVVESVLWEQGLRAMQNANIDFLIEFGPGRSLSGMIRHTKLTVTTLSIDTMGDLDLCTTLQKDKVA